jgi:hypothetical protein
MTTRIAVWVAWAALALALASMLIQGTVWWVWVMWGMLTAGVGVLHLRAHEADLM